MNLRDVGVFVVVAGESHLDAAARRLALSAAQLHESLRRLERAIGARLLVEDTNEVKLTPVGSQFRAHAERGLRALYTATARESQANTRRIRAAASRSRAHQNVPRRGRLAYIVGTSAPAGIHQSRWPGTTLRYGDVEIDLVEQTVLVAGRLVVLTRKEFQLLAMIATARGTVCTREALIKDIWYRKGSAMQNTLNVHLTTLRAKLGRPDLILTIRGIGYRMASEPEEPGVPEATAANDSVSGAQGGR